MTFKVFAAGNSVVWGQGLLTHQKFHELASKELAAELNLGTPDITLRARSGAVTDGHDLDEPIPRNINLWQEVPNDTPTVLEQVKNHSPNPDDTVELVILDGGINDIQVFKIMLDHTQAELEELVAKNCYEKMRLLLRTARQRFPAAVIVVTGYFPYLSRQSQLDVTRVFLTLMMSKGQLLATLVSLAAAKAATRKVRLFHQRQLRWLRRAVSETHADPALRGPGVLFVHPAFGPQHAVGAPEKLLWSPVNPTQVGLAEWWRLVQDRPAHALAMIEPHPTDPVSDARRAACDEADLPLGRTVFCKVAALGHPDQAGARRYADALKKVYLEHRHVSLRSNIRLILNRSTQLSLREAMERYALPTSGSVRTFAQHFRVDSLDVRIRTRSDTPAPGTDNNVFFSISRRDEWLLNEKLFDGDVFDDFESGTVGLYTIDPANGDPEGRLHLGDIEKLELRVEGSLGLFPAWKPDWLKLYINGIEVPKRFDISATLRGGDTWQAPDYPQ